jgi:peptide/nickel transport system permease protein
VIFLVMDVLPGDPAAVMLGTSATADTLSALRHAMGLDQPLLARYLHWIVGACRGDLGTSFTYGVPVAGLIAERLTVTLPLAGMAILLAMLVGIPLGATAAAGKGGLFDHGAAVLSQAFIAIPGFWVGLILIAVFAVAFGVLPSGGFPGWSADPGEALAALILPTFALALPQAGVLTRVTRSAVLEVMNEDFVRTARAKGLSRKAALWRHAVPNALIPVVTILGLQFTFLIAGAVLVENVFALPGLGRLAYQSLLQRDLVVMQDVVLFYAGLVIVVNFLVDLAYLMLDPRLRTVRK